MAVQLLALFNCVCLMNKDAAGKSSTAAKEPARKEQEPTVDSAGQPGFAATLEDRLNGDRKLGLRLLKIFIEDTPAKLEEIGKALAAGDLVQARRLAHALCGAAVVIGAQDINLALRDLLEGCRKEELNLARKGLSKVEVIYSELEKDLRQIIALWSNRAGTGEDT